MSSSSSTPPSSSSSPPPVVPFVRLAVVGIFLLVASYKWMLQFEKKQWMPSLWESYYNTAAECQGGDDPLRPLIPLEELTGWNDIVSGRKKIVCQDDQEEYMKDFIVPPGFRRRVGAVNETEGSLEILDGWDEIPKELWLKNNNRKIPKLIHQTGRTRCVTAPMRKAPHMWLRDVTDHSYHFHDDDAVTELFNSRIWREFPQLATVYNLCVLRGTLKADLWRLLVLWEYGGIYADMDTGPGVDFVLEAGTPQARVMIEDDDDAFFVICGPWGVLSQYFMAASPKHPLIYHAIQGAIDYILSAQDIGDVWPVAAAGPRRVFEAYVIFRADAGVTDIEGYHSGPILHGERHQLGTANRTVTIAGFKSDQIEDVEQRRVENDRYVIQEVIGRGEKTQEYHKMKMTHFHEESDKTLVNKTCLESIYGSQPRQ